jgi:regulatory protein
MTIAALKRKGKNVTVIFDNDDHIVLDYNTVLDSGLRKNDVIDENKREELEYQSRLQRIKYTAFRLLSNRAHSSVELKRKLLSKGFELIPVEKVISSLTDDRFLNDEDFSSAYIEERSVKKKIGPQKIKAELFKRGVDRKVIEKLIVNIDPEQNFENLVNLATKKFKSIRNREQDFRKLRFKLYSYLSSRGFESDLIQKVLDLPYFKE